MASLHIHPSLLGYLPTSNLTYLDYVLLATALIAGTRAVGKGILWDKPDSYHYKWFERPQAQNGSSTARVKQSRDIGQRLEDGGYDLLILWGSQSGTAESFAQRLAKDLHQRLKMKALVLDLDDYDHDTTSSIPRSKFAIFILSTYGEGEPSDNAASFLKWLQSPSNKHLVNLQYAALGLGNRNYRLFNKAVDDVTVALDNNGATSLMPTVKADEATRSTEEDFVEWKRTLMGVIASKYALTESEPEYEPMLKVEELPSTENDSGKHITNTTSVISITTTSSLVHVPVKSRRNLITSEGDLRQTLHLEIDLSDHPQVKYKTGDHILIWPQNSSDEVTRLLRVLGLEGGKDVLVNIGTLEGDNSALKLPPRTTIDNLFRNHLEIVAPIKRETLLYLAQYVNSTNAKLWLQDLARDKKAFADLLANNHITLARILEQAHRHYPAVTWSGIPLSLIVESLPPMTPRYYSISSSSIISPRRVAITVSVKPTQLPSNPSVSISGLTSTYLSTLSIPSAIAASETVTLPQQSLDAYRGVIPVQIRRSSFKLPASSSTPIIMVAAGSGIAPFRAFIQQRVRLAATSSTGINGSNIGRMLLFFGCQHPERDFLYKDELLEMQQRCETLGAAKLDIVPAFSRLSENGQYVQDRVGERVDEVCKLMLEDDACLYICGAVKMAKAVGEVIGAKLREGQRWDEERFALWRNERKRTKRWHEDVWG